MAMVSFAISVATNVLTLGIRTVQLMPIQMLCARVALATLGLRAFILLVRDFDDSSLLLRSLVGGPFVNFVFGVLHLHLIVVFTTGGPRTLRRRIHVLRRASVHRHAARMQYLYPSQLSVAVHLLCVLLPQEMCAVCRKLLVAGRRYSLLGLQCLVDVVVISRLQQVSVVCVCSETAASSSRQSRGAMDDGQRMEGGQAGTRLLWLDDHHKISLAMNPGHTESGGGPNYCARTGCQCDPRGNGA